MEIRNRWRRLLRRCSSCPLPDAQISEDNFNEGQLDLTRWNIETGTGVNGDWGTGGTENDV